MVLLSKVVIMVLLALPSVCGCLKRIEGKVGLGCPVFGCSVLFDSLLKRDCKGIWRKRLGKEKVRLNWVYRSSPPSYFHPPPGRQAQHTRGPQFDSSQSAPLSSDHGHLLIDLYSHTPKCIRPPREDTSCYLALRESDEGWDSQHQESQNSITSRLRTPARLITVNSQEGVTPSRRLQEDLKELPQTQAYPVTAFRQQRRRGEFQQPPCVYQRLANFKRKHGDRVPKAHDFDNEVISHLYRTMTTHKDWEGTNDKCARVLRHERGRISNNCYSRHLRGRGRAQAEKPEAEEPEAKEEDENESEESDDSSDEIVVTPTRRPREATKTTSKHTRQGRWQVMIHAKRGGQNDIPKFLVRIFLGVKVRWVHSNGGVRYHMFGNPKTPSTNGLKCPGLSWVGSSGFPAPNNPINCSMPICCLSCPVPLDFLFFHHVLFPSGSQYDLLAPEPVCRKSRSSSIHSSIRLPVSYHKSVHFQEELSHSARPKTPSPDTVSINKTAKLGRIANHIHPPIHRPSQLFLPSYMETTGY
ncbi:hypothetical protein N656DRAFT_817380 [Canariomyces notabilis]|uniref:Uncharacterized protein n=1 Tax=Canariomyces notabilis TaxID=2074819 RepID=A0AAN6QDG7_9PEZI|nr:hypothetical protein N656DRAFT_817380 [Canariomyces arenarius]